MPKKEYDTYCSVCGFPLQAHQVGAIIKDGWMTNYIKRTEGMATITLCIECYVKVESTYKGGMRAAMKKQRELRKTDSA